MMRKADYQNQMLLDMNVEFESCLKKILVIDDDENVLDWFRHLHGRSSHYNIFLLQNELKVLETMDEVHPDLIFLDLHLGHVAGDKIGEIIRSVSPFTIPVVYMSASSPGTYERKINENAFMRKPLTRPQVEGKIQKLLKI